MVEVVLPFSVKLLSGAVGGVVGTACVFPIDLVRTKECVR